MNKTVDQLKEKIELFKNNIKNYKGKNYDEYNTRADFIDTVFSSLGWDMYNEQGVIEQFREVIREDKVEIEGKKKKPDYSFKIGPQIVFYVEAKKPSVDIKNDPEPAYQLRRYAHTQGLKLSILTDFEEIAVYDTRIKPSPKDSSAIGRIFYCTYDKLFDNCPSDDYETNFDFLLKTFSKQAILNGSFDRYAEENKNKKGTASVDKGFLELLNKWREILAANIALKNENIDEYNLNIAVQKIIDRLVFLRIAEDRLIEEPNFLISKTKQEKIYSHLLELFIKADEKYNSGLFITEEWLKSLIIEDTVFKEIIEEMYYPKCPYEFSVLPIEILGNAYEQFLGKTIKYVRKTKYGHKVEIEEKPEVRKAGGVYYTPDYIVDYIVKNTVGEKIKNNSPEKAREIKIIDPACGSGSFLIGAYDFLVHYHLEYYLSNETRKKRALKEGIIYQISDSKYKLSTSMKSEILVNNIFGVDIDLQAVEVTKLSLLLKVLEDENLEYKEELFKAEHYHLLPDLSENIKCGNSLIEDDYFENNQKDLFDNTKSKKINAFNWEEQFPNIFNTGKFDVVIGNPPWVSLSGKFGNDILTDEQLSYLIQKYNGNTYMPNLYEYFVWKGLFLVKENGFFSFIVPDRLGFNQQFINLRKYILDNFQIKNLIYKADFPGVIADTLIFIFNKNGNEENLINVKEYGCDNQEIPQKSYYNNSDFAFTYQQSENVTQILNQIDSIEHVDLSECFDTTGGFGGKSKLITDTRINDKQIEVIKGASIGKYTIKNILYFEFKKQNITGRTTDKDKLGAKPKILIRKTGYPLYAAYDEKGIYPEQSLYFLFNNKTELPYYFFLGILNSNVFNFYYWNKLVTNKNSTPQLKKIHLDIFPIPKIDSEEKEKLAENISNATKSIIDLTTNKIVDNSQFEKLEKFLNKYIYELYQLNDDNVKQLLEYI